MQKAPSVGDTESGSVGYTYVPTCLAYSTSLNITDWSITRLCMLSGLLRSKFSRLAHVCLLVVLMAHRLQRCQRLTVITPEGREICSLSQLHEDMTNFMVKSLSWMKLEWMSMNVLGKQQEFIRSHSSNMWSLQIYDTIQIVKKRVNVRSVGSKV